MNEANPHRNTVEKKFSRDLSDEELLLEITFELYRAKQVMTQMNAMNPFGDEGRVNREMWGGMLQYHDALKEKALEVTKRIHGTDWPTKVY